MRLPGGWCKGGVFGFVVGTGAALGTAEALVDADALGLAVATVADGGAIRFPGGICVGSGGSGTATVEVGTSGWSGGAIRFPGGD